MRTRHFADGYMADNILVQLDRLDQSQIKKMYARKDFIQIADQTEILTCSNLRIEKIEAYADTCQCSLRKLLFGTEDAPQTCYTVFGNDLIRALNEVSDDVLRKTYEYIKGFYWNASMDISGTTYQKFNAFMPKIRKPEPEKITDEMRKCFIMEDPLKEIERYKGYNNSENFKFAPDYMPDIANILKISLAWFLNLKKYPLICDTFLADAVLSLITLQVPIAQAEIIGYMLHLQKRRGEAVDPQLEQAFHEFVWGYDNAI